MNSHPWIKCKRRLIIADIRRIKFQKPIQLACAAAGLGINNDPVESKVIPSPIGLSFSYTGIDYKVMDITSGKRTL